jgi:hypothetical protein
MTTTNAAAEIAYPPGSYEIVEGTRTAPGRVLRTFSAAVEYPCGGPATACLRAWERLVYTRGRRNGAMAFFRRAA